MSSSQFKISRVLPFPCSIHMTYIKDSNSSLVIVLAVWSHKGNCVKRKYGVDCKCYYHRKNTIHKLFDHAISEVSSCLQMLALGQAWSYVSLIEQQFVVTHTICQTDIPSLLDSRVTNTPFSKMLCPEKKLLVIIFV